MSEQASWKATPGVNYDIGALLETMIPIAREIVCELYEFLQIEEHRDDAPLSLRASVAIKSASTMIDVMRNLNVDEWKCARANSKTKKMSMWKMMDMISMLKQFEIVHAATALVECPPSYVMKVRS